MRATRVWVVAAAISCMVAGASASATTRSLDGGGNNLAHPNWGPGGTPYPRIAPPAYADGVGSRRPAPPARYVSNRIFNDVGQNLFSENGVTQWGWVWGQFLDHTSACAQETRGETAPIAFDPQDPLESFRNDFGAIDFRARPPRPAPASDAPREQLNTV